jgi:hypothetical protein
MNRNTILYAIFCHILNAGQMIRMLYARFITIMTSENKGCKRKRDVECQDQDETKTHVLRDQDVSKTCLETTSVQNKT